MDEEERQKKLEAGKAKLASFRKKKHSSKKKKKKTDTTPGDGSHSEEVGAGDSIAVQTGDDSSIRALSPSDESERSTTTAEDISTEEEGGYGLSITAVERIQELELTVSDQQAALQKLTLENKALRDKSDAAVAQKALLERDSVINELRDSVAQSAQHVRLLQQQLTKTTDAVIDSGGEQGQIVAELTETRQKLDAYEHAIIRQEEAMLQMAQKLEEKSIEAGEALDRCRSLQTELDKSQSQLTSSEQTVSGALHSMEEELHREKERHKEEITLLKQHHQAALDSALNKIKQMEEDQATPLSYDPEDVRAYREQVSLLQTQLETAYRDIDKLKRDHDKEVIQLNQQLVGTVDEYETKLQDQLSLCDDYQQRLEMSDTVSSEIQASFSKQLEQLEEERDTLRQQLRQAQAHSKENTASKIKIKDLETEVVSYQKELADVSSQLEEAEKQKRRFRDDMERAQEATERINKEKLKLAHELEQLHSSLDEQKCHCDQLSNEIEGKSQEIEALVTKHRNEVEELGEKNSSLAQRMEEEALKTRDQLKSMSNEHTEELKNLHSQHHRQMDELKRDMERQLEITKCSLEEARKDQLETVKDVHERNREREFERIKEDHQSNIEALTEQHKKDIEIVKTEAKEVKKLAEERLRIELKEEFDASLENELSILRRSLEQESDVAQAEITERYENQMKKMKSDHKDELDLCVKDELAKQQQAHEKELLAQKAELDDALEAIKGEFENAQEIMSLEHAEALAKMEVELEEFHKSEGERESSADETVKTLEEKLKQSQEIQDALKVEISKLRETFEEQLQKLEDDHKSQLESRDAALEEQWRTYEMKQDAADAEMDSLKEELAAVQVERDEIFTQAEESQKRLAALHHEESVRMQEEVEELEAKHQEKVEQMQYEIDSLRTSRDDLKDLRSQLSARNAALEEITRIREEFAEERERLIKEKEMEKEELEKHFNEEMEKALSERKEEIDGYQHKIDQLLGDLQESKDKLEEVASRAAPIESSPMRPLSQMSDYDSSNVVALNKDYRSAMTLTHVADVSGLSEPTSQVLEDSGAETIYKEEHTKWQEEIASLQQRLKEVEEESVRLKEDHGQAVESLQEEHNKQLSQSLVKKDEELKTMQKSHDEALANLEKSHAEAIDNLNASHQKEIVQFHLKSASEAAAQIEKEKQTIYQQFTSEYDSVLDAVKQQMAVESDEKLEAERQKHAEELEEQSKNLSSSMEVRLAALMSELHEQKQEALQKASHEHQEEIKNLRVDFDVKIQELSEKEEKACRAWQERKEELERDVEKLTKDFESSKDDYRKLILDLDSGSHEYMRTLQVKHEEDIENLRKRLEEEHEERQEAALKKQALIFKQAQDDFMKLHEDQLEKFVSGQKEDVEIKEKEIEQRIDEIKESLKQEFESEKKDLIDTHSEEMKVVATKLVEVDAERVELGKVKTNLLSQLESLQEQKVEELADLKTALVNQHMMKFQEVTANLDQLHREEMENLIRDHQEKESVLQGSISSLEEKITSLEADLRKQEEEKETRITEDEVTERIKKLEEDHDEKVKMIQSDREAQLEQIAEEIAKQDEEHQVSMQKLLSSQAEDLEGLQKQFDEALSKATEASLAESQKMSQRVLQLESELKEADGLKQEMEDARERRRNLESLLEERKMKMEAWDEERNEERKVYERKLNELSESLSCLQEEYKDLNARVEFERAEYEAEIESIQEEGRNKDENIKELEAEVDHKTAALDSLVKQKEQLEERRERESQEGDNLLKMLRDDLDRLSKERDNTSASNEQLLSVLSELVRTNHRCEEVIARRLENLPIMGANEQHNSESESSALPHPSSPREDTDSSATPLNTSLSGSFVDEGLDLSQRLAESMFTGPELDHSARDTVTRAGVQVGQAVERLLDMLENTVKQLNTSQHAQNLLGDELQRVMTSKQNDNNNNSDGETTQDSRVAELQKLVSDHEKANNEASNKLKDLESKEEEVRQLCLKLQQENALLKKQKDALSEGRDETELNLLRATEELANEKQMMLEQHDQEKVRLVEAAHQLEQAMDQQSKFTEENEAAYLAQIEDLTSQIDSLRKQTESRSRYADELTSDREVERDQFEREIEAMRNEIDQARDNAKAESLLAAKVAHLEEELDAKQEDEVKSTEENERLKEKIKDQEGTIKTLRGRVDDLECKDITHELQSALEESKKEEEVLQKELCGNMLRISALEAQLDRYRHGVDEDALAALERAEAEERRLKEQYLQDLEAKDAEIELLVEQQNHLRTHIIEKEEEVGRLLHLLENTKDVEAENVKLKDELEAAQSNVVQATSSPSEQLEALSQHLLEEKNAEIDELRRKIALHQTDGDKETEEMMSSLQTQVEELVSENEELKHQLGLMEDRMDEAFQRASTPPLVEEAVQKASSVADEDTGIQDLSTVDLTSHDPHQGSNVDHNHVNQLQEENALLRQQLKEAQMNAKNLLSQIQEDILHLPPGTKEKIRDLEERLEKEQEESSSSDSSSDEEAEGRTADNSLRLTHSNVIDHKGEKSDQTKPKKESNIIKEKLKEIEEELRSDPSSILGRILAGKDETLSCKDQLLQKLESKLSKKHDEIAALNEHMAQLQHELNEPDVRIQLHGGDRYGPDAIETEEREHEIKEEEEETKAASHQAHSSSTSDASEDQDEEALKEDDSEEALGEEDALKLQDEEVLEDGVTELKMLLDEKEEEILKYADTLAEKDTVIQDKEDKLLEMMQEFQKSEAKCVELETELKMKCEELEDYILKHPDEDLPPPALQDEVIQMRVELNDMMLKVSSAQEDRNRMSKQLDDVQRECSSLLDDNRLLEEEKIALEDVTKKKTSRLEELEDVLREKDVEIEQLKETSTALNNRFDDVIKELNKAKALAEEKETEQNQLQMRLDKLSVHEKEIPLHAEMKIEQSVSLQTTQPMHAGGDTAQHEEAVSFLQPTSSEDESAEIERLLEENTALRDEITILTLKTENLEEALEVLKQEHIEKCQSLNASHALVKAELEMKLQQLHESAKIRPIVEDETLELSSHKRENRVSSTESRSSQEDVEELIEELKRDHEEKMQDIKLKYACELDDAVAKAIKEHEELSNKRLSELEEKHRREINEILSESVTAGENELAERLWSELDLADKLDKELIDQLATAAQQHAQPSQLENETLSSSPEKDAEISSKLQQLLSRLHNEGVQVLTLSELQFLKHHQTNRNVSMNTDPEAPPVLPSVDVDGLKRAWDSEKLALLDAIQALKDLLTQTASESAQLSDDDENLKWRGELLRSVADLFEREKRAVLAELRASVIEAHGEAELNSELDAASRLETLERKIRNQELQHRTELERLLAADRDRLVDDVKQLKAERKEKLEQAYERIHQLQEQHKFIEETNKSNTKQLQNEVECLKSKLEQEEALTSDLQTSLETEKQRSRGLLPALERERQRTLELSSEVANLSENHREKLSDAKHEIEELKCERDDFSEKLQKADETIKTLQEECESKDNDITKAREKQEEINKEAGEAITHLQAALSTEEKRRLEAAKAIEVERQNNATLHQELASERATSYDEVIQLKNRCDDLTSAVNAEKGRCEELQGALEREVQLTRQVREELASERKMTAEAREHDRATVTDLQAILVDAKKESERIQKRVVLAEQEREEAIRRCEEEQISAMKKVDQEKASRDEALTRERKAQTELQTALELEKIRKQDAQRRVQELEDQQKELIRQQERLPSPRDVQDTMLTHRRQLESLRQRLQLEASKLQNLVDRTSHKSTPRDHSSDTISPSNSILSSDEERFESMKRALQDMQDELKELYSNISFPERTSRSSSVRPIEFNDKLLQQNAELSDHAANAAREARELRDALASLEEEKRRAERADELPNQQNQQKMASRMHRIYNRYLRAESFRKSLVYQKKYLLLLLGGFQDCEEATLALIARMGAYPSNDALRRTVSHRSEAFTRFRSAARVVIAVCRLKFLVRKWKKNSISVSAAIESKHGVPVSSVLSGASFHPHRASPSPHLHHFSPAASPRLEMSPTDAGVPSHMHDSHTSVHSYPRYSNEPPSHDHSPYSTGHRLSYNQQPSRSSYDNSYDRSHTSYNGDHSRISPADALSYSPVDRSVPADTDPSLNEYIRKLENIQHKLRYPR